MPQPVTCVSWSVSVHYPGRHLRGGGAQRRVGDDVQQCTGRAHQCPFDSVDDLIGRAHGFAVQTVGLRYEREVRVRQ